MLIKSQRTSRSRDKPVYQAFTLRRLPCLGRGRLRMSVTINGTICHNCWDVDWAKKAEREQIEKHAAEARKAKEATASPGSSPDISSGSDQTSSLDKQSATILGGALKGAAKSDGVVPAGNSAATASAASSEPGRSINIFA